MWTTTQQQIGVLRKWSKNKVQKPRKTYPGSFGTSGDPVATKSCWLWCSIMLFGMKTIVFFTLHERLFVLYIYQAKFAVRLSHSTQTRKRTYLAYSAWTNAEKKLWTCLWFLAMFGLFALYALVVFFLFYTKTCCFVTKKIQFIYLTRSK